jgi:hypothetical protein
MIATKLRSNILKKPFNPAHNESEQNQYPKPMLPTTAMMAKTNLNQIL